MSVSGTTLTDQCLRKHSSYLGSNGRPNNPGTSLPSGYTLLSLIPSLGGPFALRARVACYRAAKDGRATEPPSASRPMRVTPAAARSKDL